MMSALGIFRKSANSRRCTMVLFFGFKKEFSQLDRKEGGT